MMAQANFDTESFHAALDSQRMAMNLTWKDVAAESGVSASTLTRMSQGKRPDVDGLAALLKWSGLLAEMFIAKSEAQSKKKPDVLAQITALLRADPGLKKESAAAIEEILRAAYKRFKEP
jgi:transcriptional regulator with XRE-family HTH domain